MVEVAKWAREHPCLRSHAITIRAPPSPRKVGIPSPRPRWSLIYVGISECNRRSACPARPSDSLIFLHFILFPGSSSSISRLRPPSLPPHLPCRARCSAAATVSSKTFLMEQVSLGVRRVGRRTDLRLEPYLGLPLSVVE